MIPKIKTIDGRKYHIEFTTKKKRLAKEHLKNPNEYQRTRSYRIIKLSTGGYGVYSAPKRRK